MLTIRIKSVFSWLIMVFLLVFFQSLTVVSVGFLYEIDDACTNFEGKDMPSDNNSFSSELPTDRFSIALLEDYYRDGVGSA